MCSLYPIIDGWYHHDMDDVKHARDLRMNGCICVILSMQSDWKSPEIVLFKTKTFIKKNERIGELPFIWLEKMYTFMLLNWCFLHTRI